MQKSSGIYLPLLGWIMRILPSKTNTTKFFLETNVNEIYQIKRYKVQKETWSPWTLTKVEIKKLGRLAMEK